MSEAVVFGIVGVALVVVFALVYGWPRKKDGGGWSKRYLSPTFARVYGLLAIAVLAVAAVKLTDDAAVLTGVFTLFGTIAGYLAGSKVEAITAPASGGNQSDDGKPDTKDPGPPASNQTWLELN